MAVTMRRCDVERIARYSRTMDTLDAIGCCHWTSIHPILPRRTPWSSISAQKMELWNCETAVLKLASKKARDRPSTQLIKAASCFQRLNTMIKTKELGNFSSYQTGRLLDRESHAHKHPHHDGAVFLWSSMVLLAEHTLPPESSAEGAGQGRHRSVLEE